MKAPKFGRHFIVGAEWHSHDGGRNWFRGPIHKCGVSQVDGHGFRVTRVNRKTGTITVKAL